MKVSHKKKRRRSGAGNTLAEYALPIALVVVASGVIAASVDIQTAIPQFFASASGSTVSGSNVVAQSYGDNAHTANGNGGSGFTGAPLDGQAGLSAAGLGLYGSETPQIEVSGGMGTNKALAFLNDNPPDMVEDNDEGDYEATSTYVAMVKDLALTTANADDAAKYAGGKKGEVLDQYASAVAAKSNAINQFAKANVMQVIKYGGLKGLQDVDNYAEKSTDEFDAGDDTRADHYGEKEEEAVTTDDTSTQEEKDGASTATGQFLWSLNLYANTQYKPIEEDLFTQWREQNLNQAYGGNVTIWGIDYKGNVDVLKESWGAFLDKVD